MIDLEAKYVDRLPQSTINKLKKAMYRVVDLIELFFPHPKDPTKKIKLDFYQKIFIDTIQFGYPLALFKYGEVPPEKQPKGIINIMRRQVGKSISCGYTGAGMMVLGPTSRGHPPCFCGIVAASEEESKLLIDKVKYCFEESDLNELVAGKSRVDKIKLTNGSYTKSHTCSHRSIRGPSYDIIFIDEGAQMDENILFTAAIPTVTHGDRWVIITTPQGSKGQLIEYYIKGVETRPVICKNCRTWFKQEDFPYANFPVKNRIWEIPKLEKCKVCGSMDYFYGMGIFATPYLDPWRCSIIDKVELENILKVFGNSPWARQEYLGEVTDEASMVILKKWIDANTEDRLRNKFKRVPNTFYVLGMDYGRLHDAASFCITHRDKKTQRIVLDYMETISGEYDVDTDYDAIQDTMKKIVQYFRPTLLVLDSTGVGYPEVERVKKALWEWGVNTKILNNTKEKVLIGGKTFQRLGFYFTKKSKMDLVSNMITLLSQIPTKLMIPPSTEPEIKQLVTELLRYECEVLEAGYIKYGTQNYHDDRVTAYALSLWGHRKQNIPRGRSRGFQYDVFDDNKLRLKNNRRYNAKVIKSVF